MRQGRNRRSKVADCTGFLVFTLFLFMVFFVGWKKRLPLHPSFFSPGDLNIFLFLGVDLDQLFIASIRWCLKISDTGHEID